MRVPTIAAVGLGLLLASALTGGQEPTKANSGLKSLKQKFSYALGLDMGKRMKGQSVDLDPDILARGIKDGLVGKAQLTPEQIQQSMEEFKRELDAKNTKNREAFLAENKKKPGVVTLPSGLQYNILKEGTGRSPKATDSVSAHYEGKLIDGTVFDSSYQRGRR